MTHPDSSEQLKSIRIDPDRPLVICDADGVIFEFMRELESFLAEREYYYNWSSFRLNGNIVDCNTDVPLSAHDVHKLIGNFLDLRTRDMCVFPDAPAALEELQEHAQAVVLTNLPYRLRDARINALRDNGISIPVILNEGTKAPAVAALAERTSKTSYFIDDLPSHHAEAAIHAPAVKRILFVGDKRLDRMLDEIREADFRARSWKDVIAYVTSTIE